MWFDKSIGDDFNVTMGDPYLNVNSYFLPKETTCIPETLGTVSDIQQKPSIVEHHTNIITEQMYLIYNVN